MTKKDTKWNVKQLDSLRKDLVALKLSVINYHNDTSCTSFAYLRERYAADNCFSSYGAMKWKSEQVESKRDEIAAMIDTGSEVDQVTIERALSLAEKMADELAELTLRHEADLTVHHQIVGTEWVPGTRQSQKKKVDPAVIAKAKAFASK